ncbi:MAG: helix-turn-helix transcriptional regulator [Eggerthellaceae bacterium]|nr:helix-turn-helix transcriptional regulator [Eggerthellaceae bacterium]
MAELRERHDHPADGMTAATDSARCPQPGADHGRASGAEGPSLRAAVLGGVALALSLAATSLMNVAVFPLFDAIFTFARDISVTAGALTFLAIGLVSYRAPRMLTPRSYALITAVSLVGGGALLAAALLTGAAPLLVAGSCLFAVGRTGTSVLAYLALSTLPTLRAAGAICLACLAQFVVGGLTALPPVLGVALYLALPCLAAAIAFPVGSAVLRRAAVTEPPSDWAVTRPMSFIAPLSSLFVCLFLFNVAFGFSLRFDEVAGAPQSTAVSALPALVAAAWVIGTRRRFPADLAVRLSALVIIAGLLLASTGQPGYVRAAVTLLNAGNALFGLTAQLALVAIASRNLLGAVTVIAWGQGASSVGSLVGAAAGMVANASVAADHSLVFPIAAVLLLLFASYLILGMGDFSFQRVIDGVEPLDPEAASEAPADVFVARCEELAADHGLTPREAEVFQMLARGRNREYIEEALVVSRNTVKAHVKHIYAKLGIHSHQELIDLVEG